MKRKKKEYERNFTPIEILKRKERTSLTFADKKAHVFSLCNVCRRSVSCSISAWLPWPASVLGMNIVRLVCFLLMFGIVVEVD